MPDTEQYQPDTPIVNDSHKISEGDENEILLGDDEVSDGTEEDEAPEREELIISEEDIGDISEIF
jgi:hypothetical protein